MHSFLYRHKVVTSEAVAEQVRSCQSLMSFLATQPLGPVAQSLVNFDRRLTNPLSSTAIG